MTEFPNLWRRRYVHTVCATVSSLSKQAAEEFAHNALVSGNLYCPHENNSFPVTGFTWYDDGTVVGGGLSTADETYTPPTPPPTITAWGAVVGPNTNPGVSDSATEFDRVNALLPTGKRWTMRRSYQSGTETAVPAQTSGLLPFRSMKPNLTTLAGGTTLDATITSWINSMPNGAYATIQHEPDNPTKGISAATFDAGFNKFATLAKAANPLVKIGPVVMDFQIRAQGAGYHYGQTIDWTKIDFWGVDVYSAWDIAYRTFAQCMAPAMTYYNAIHSGLPFVAAEAGLPTHPITAGNGYTTSSVLDRPTWVHDGLVWGAANNTTMFLYNANVDATHDFKLSDAEIAALGALL